MTPMPVKPTVVILINKNAPNLVEAVASNIARTDDPEDPLIVKVVTTAIDFANESQGVTFNSTVPRPEQMALSSKASKARYATA